MDSSTSTFTFYAISLLSTREEMVIGEDEMEENFLMRHAPALMTGASAEEVRERCLADARAIRPESDGWQHDVRVVAHTVIATLAETDEPRRFNVSLQIKGNYGE